MNLDHAEYSEHFGQSVIFAAYYALGMDGTVPAAVSRYIRDTCHLLTTSDLALLTIEISKARKHGKSGSPGTDAEIWEPLEHTLLDELDSRDDALTPHNHRNARLEDIIFDGEIVCPDCECQPIAIRKNVSKVKLTCPHCGWIAEYTQRAFQDAFVKSNAQEQSATDRKASKLSEEEEKRIKEEVAAYRKRRNRCLTKHSRARNAEHYKEYQRRYYIANKDKLAAYKSEYNKLYYAAKKALKAQKKSGGEADA